MSSVLCQPEGQTEEGKTGQEKNGQRHKLIVEFSTATLPSFGSMLHSLQ